MLEESIEQSLENLKIKKTYSIDNTDEFIADFVQNLILYIESDSEIKVEILSVDIEKGLLDVNVIETFEQPNGSTKSISCRKTVIMESYTDSPLNYFTLRFLVPEDDDVDSFGEYKIITISEDGTVILPTVAPEKEGYTFKGWSYTKPAASNSYSPEIISATDVDGKLTVEENLVFYAVFEEN